MNLERGVSERCFSFVFSDSNLRLPRWFCELLGVPDCASCEGFKDNANGCQYYLPVIFEVNYESNCQPNEIKKDYEG